MFGVNLGASDAEQMAYAQIKSAIAKYRNELMKVAELQQGSLQKRISYATKMLLDSPNAKLSAVLRSHSKIKKPAKPSDLVAISSELSVWEPLTEPVRVFWKPKSDGKFRPITKFGPRRKAQALMLRDMLAIVGIEAVNNYATKGAGGERALVKKICELACCRICGHRDKVFSQTGELECSAGSLRESSRLRRSG